MGGISTINPTLTAYDIALPTLRTLGQSNLEISYVENQPFADHCPEEPINLPHLCQRLPWGPNVGIAIINHPPIITIFMGGIN